MVDRRLLAIGFLLLAVRLLADNDKRQELSPFPRHF
jgi:hypothetical protein